MSNDELLRASGFSLNVNATAIKWLRAAANFLLQRTYLSPPTTDQSVAVAVAVSMSVADDFQMKGVRFLQTFARVPADNGWIDYDQLKRSLARIGGSICGQRFGAVQASTAVESAAQSGWLETCECTTEPTNKDGLVLTAVRASPLGMKEAERLAVMLAAGDGLDGFAAAMVQSGHIARPVPPAPTVDGLATVARKPGRPRSVDAKKNDCLLEQYKQARRKGTSKKEFIRTQPGGERLEAAQASHRRRVKSPTTKQPRQNRK